jgi:TRAP-type mannitol/chloroaromatic compound transport system permease small subunit
MQQLANWIDQLNERIGKAVSWLTLALVMLVFGNVFLRYVLNAPKAWAKELEWHLFALIFLLAAGYSFKHNRHVRVDLFYEKMTSADRTKVDHWGTIIFLLPWCLVLMYTGWTSAMDAYSFNERSPEAGGLPNLWLIQFAIPFGMLLLFLQGVALLLRKK